MDLFGLTITRRKQTELRSVSTLAGWWRIIGESFTGAWQSNVSVTLDNVLTHPTVFACVALISSSVAKMALRLVERRTNDIWIPTENPAFSPFLRQPNRYQTPYKFIEQWIISKLVHGNTYVLKQRDGRGLVVAGYILDPTRVRPLVSADGSVFYELTVDPLGQTRDRVVAPAREIFHDLMYPLYHPLQGIPPLYASGVAATLGLTILTNSSNFFANGSNPGGVLTAPGQIEDATAARLKAYWETNFSGANRGKVAVLGDGLKFEVMRETAEQSQLPEQWTATAEAVATSFLVPYHLVGGPPPPYNNVQALTVQFWTSCIQALTVQLEQVMDRGLALPPSLGTEFDQNDLLWMDTLTMMDVVGKGINAAVFTPNEGRAFFNKPGVEGGDQPYLQRQFWPLLQLGTDQPQQPTVPVAATPEQTDAELQAATWAALNRKLLERPHAS